MQEGVTIETVKVKSLIPSTGFMWKVINFLFHNLFDESLGMFWFKFSIAHNFQN